MSTDLHIPPKAPQNSAYYNALKKVPVTISVWVLINISRVWLWLYFFWLCSINVPIPCTHITSIYNLGITGRQWQSSLCCTRAAFGMVQRLAEMTGVIISNKDPRDGNQKRLVQTLSSNRTAYVPCTTSVVVISQEIKSIHPVRLFSARKGLYCTKKTLNLFCDQSPRMIVYWLFEFLLRNLMPEADLSRF